MCFYERLNTYLSFVIYSTKECSCVDLGLMALKYISSIMGIPHITWLNGPRVWEFDVKYMPSVSMHNVMEKQSN